MTDTLPKDTVDALALLAKATPGPWKCEFMGGDSTVLVPTAPGINGRPVRYGYRDAGPYCLSHPFYDEHSKSFRHDFTCFSHDDAALIVAAVNLLPRLAERVMWQPIETYKPVDNERTMVMQGGRRFIAEWDDCAGQWQGLYAVDGLERENYFQEWPGRLYGVTHLLPLPTPPVSP